MAKNKNTQRPFAAELTMAEDTAVLDVRGVIGWNTDPVEFTSLVQQAKDSGATKLTVRINSLGGYCYDGLAIGDCLRTCGMETTAVVIGTAQSMASYILQCCDMREAHRNATIMFHQPSAGVCGTVDEILNEAQYLCALRDRMFEDMGKRCGMSGADLSAEHQTTKLYTAEQALARGFIDRISGEDASEDDGTPEPAAPTQCARGVYEYERVQMGLAMMAEEPSEEEPEEEPENEPKEPENTENADSEEVTPEPKEEPEEEPENEPKEPENNGATACAALVPADEPVPAHMGEYMTREQVEELLAARDARMMAEMGAPASALPASTAGGSNSVSSHVQYTMAELNAMPAMQRLAVLEQNPALAAQYAAAM